MIIVKAAHMKRDVRQQMIEGALRLLAQNGLQATSFSDVLELTQAPRGSIYHHFPEGKNQLVKAALELAGARTLYAIDQLEGLDAEEITNRFLLLWRDLLVRAQFRAGCSVLAVTVAADSQSLLDQAAIIFRTWRGKLAELYEKSGIAKRQAVRFAATLIAASEGAVVLSRAEHSMEPFDLVSQQMVDQIKQILQQK